MGLSIFGRDSPRRAEFEKGTNGRPEEAVVGQDAPARNSTSGESNASAGTLTSPKRASRFRLGSLKQLGMATRAEIREKVRNDWDWPLPEIAEAEPAETAHNNNNNHTNDEEKVSETRSYWASRVGADTPYVERAPGSEESEDPLDEEEEEEELARAAAAAAAARHSRSQDGANNNNNGGGIRLLNGNFGHMARARRANGHHKSASSDSRREIAALARKERRRRRLREELAWNDGLQVFEARRNAWTGSVLKPPAQTARELGDSRKLENGTVNGSTDGSMNGTANGTAKKPTSDAAPTAKGTAKVQENANGDVNGATKNGQHEARAETSKVDKETEAEIEGANSTTEDAETTPAAEQDLIPFVPLPPPLISPDHPVRKQINPSSYQQIYSRVVVQGTTPNLPINLADMTSILIEGWKADDQWPPRPSGPLDPLVGRRKSRGDGAQMNGHGRSKNGSSIYQGLKKVLRIGTEKEAKNQVEPIVLANG